MVIPSYTFKEEIILQTYDWDNNKAGSDISSRAVYQQESFIRLWGGKTVLLFNKFPDHHHLLVCLWQHYQVCHYTEEVRKGKNPD